MRKLLKRHPVAVKKISHSLLLLVICLLIELYTATYVPFFTYLGTMNISGYSRSQLYTLLKKEEQLPFQIKLKDRIYRISYTQLGIHINADEIYKEVFPRESVIFPVNVLNHITHLLNPKIFAFPVIFTPEYDRFIQRMVIEPELSPYDIVVHEDKTISINDSYERFSIDKNSLKKLIIHTFGKRTIIEPALVRQPNNSQTTIEALNQKIGKMFQNSLRVRIKYQEQAYTLDLDPPTLKTITNLTIADTRTYSPSINIDTDKFWLALPSHLDTLPSTNILASIQKKVPGEVLGALTERYSGNDVSMVNVPIQNQPVKTEIPHKSIEIDISEQQMYTYESGKLRKIYKVSTGLYYPTPTGKFSILNKARNPFSEIYKVYMPYWMAFGYSNELKAYFGIHELPYWIQDGNKIQRPRERIGNPSTGGCVALDIGDAQEMYEWADIGTPIEIVE